MSRHRSGRASLTARLAFTGTIVCLALGPIPNATTGERFSFSTQVMGTRGAATFYAEGSDAANEAWHAVCRRWQELEAIFSDYRHDSESARLVTTAPLEVPQGVSTELFSVLQQARHYSESSGGALDVTVGPLTRLWRQGRRRQERPRDDLLAEARRHVGYRGYQLDPQQRTVTLLKSGLRFDFGAIAKGYAADEALQVLAARGISAAVIDLGGDLAVGNAPPHRPEWLVGVQPFSVAGDDRLGCCRCGVATSGDAERSSVISGQRLSHLLDPRSGEPLRDAWSVTVIAEDAMTADALASILTVLGADAGLPWLERHHPEASVQFARGTAGGVESRRNTGFSRLLISGREP